jgi:hypothetical protein
MKNHQALKIALCLLVAGSLGLCTPSCHALGFHIDINTVPLIGNPAGPFSLDFQLTDGSGANDGNNSVTLSNFTFGGGGAPFGAANALGGVSGVLPGTITLTDTAFFNELYQSFTAGSTVGFDVAMSSNVDAGPTPDLFSVAILDNNLANIPTSGIGDALVLVNLDKSNPGIADVETFGGTGEYQGVTTHASVPEPSVTLMMILGLLGLFGMRNRRF